MENLVTQVGVNGIFAVLVLNMVFAFLVRKKNGNITVKQEIHDIRMIEKTDAIARAVEKNTAVLSRLVPLLERLERKA